MDNINQIINNSFQKAQSNTDNSKAKTVLGQEDFLKLLVTQMSHQNPLDPQDPGEFLGQMAQFGTVDGITQLNETMSSLSAGLQSNQALHASSMVGRKVQVNSDRAWLSHESGLNGVVSLPTDVKNLKVFVMGENGEIVNQLSLGNQKEGDFSFAWNGLDAKGNTAAEGIYKIAAEAEMGGKTVSLNTFSIANVNSVTLGKGYGNIILNLQGIGNVNLSNVKEIA